MSNDSTVLLPLRPPAEYRNESSGRFNWLSRRWIYNIPRNLQTQGLRPLARLALVDNMERAIEQVTRVLRAAANPAGTVATAVATGLNFKNPAPRVFVVSSTTGGTGSGTVLDIGYIVRQSLRHLQLPDDAVCGILAHCTGRNQQTRGLAMANAYALLGELNHYADPRNYFPGDPVAGLSSFGAEDAPFNSPYVLHLGEELDAEGFNGAVDGLAKYLYFGAMSAASTFFDRCRATPTLDCAESDSPPVRTFGLCQLGFSPNDATPEAIDEICRSLVLRWREKEPKPRSALVATLSDPTSMLADQAGDDDTPERARAAAVGRADEAGITLDKVVARFNASLAEQMGNDRQSYLRKVLEELLKKRTPLRSFRIAKLSGEAIIEALDGMIRPDATDANRLCLSSALEAPLQEILQSAGGPLREWLLGLVNSPEHRLAGAQRMTDQLAEYLREISRQAADSIQSVGHQLSSLKDTLLNDRKDGKNWLRYRGFFAKRRLVADRRLSDYFELRLNELTLSAFCRLVRMVLAQVTTTGDKLRNLATDLSRLFPKNAPTASAETDSDVRTTAMRRAAERQIAAKRSEILAEMEVALEEELRRAASTEDRDTRRKLAGTIRQASRATILRVLKQHAVQATTAELAGDSHEPLFNIKNGLKEALPHRFMTCGGQRRLLVLASEQAAGAVTPQAIGEATTASPTVVTDPFADMLVCYEIEDLPLKRIASTVLDQRFQAVEAASRLHTRTDVPWTPL